MYETLPSFQFTCIAPGCKTVVPAGEGSTCDKPAHRRLAGELIAEWEAGIPTGSTAEQSETVSSARD